MNRKEELKDRHFRIDWQGYNTDDPGRHEERVDVSPAGTEGIFIDVESPEFDSEKRYHKYLHMLGYFFAGIRTCLKKLHDNGFAKCSRKVDYKEMTRNS
jgi:hypothetical protein